ncbi:hypothetical protein GCM10007147_22520 [Nocardiopsis kunsanensis]|uniref:Uncharacterized protein n=1 Tax=Nocardiopsis kunsanensis TaxID=141693 RepID=A0A918XD72_9ACTN|nr:hypothetical protein [Nocardiopsis kunsanensis]GHD25341.1 hypothetical protein GCM10007147_22520 [Nocardiopsis kunsanensis]
MEPQSPSDRAKLRNTESPRLRRAWGTRTRRRLYTLLYLALVLVGAVMLIWSDLVRAVAVPVLAGFVVLGLLVTQLNRATRMSPPHRLLDERQRAERDAAHRFSQQTMGVLLLTVLVAVAVLTINEPLDVEFPSALALPLLWVLAMVHISLPACYLAWTQPDEPADEEDEGGDDFPGQNRSGPAQP